MSENEKPWFVDLQNEIVGPVSLETLQEWLRDGKVTTETWVRQDGANEWHPLAMVEELSLVTEGTQDLADQPAAEVPLHYLRTDEPKLTDRDKLLNRAFAVKGTAILFLAMGAFFSILLLGALAGFLICTLLMLLYYVIDSVSVVLKTSAELHEKIELLQKKLEENDVDNTTP